MTRDGRINAFLIICHQAPYGAIAPIHYHQERNGEQRPYWGKSCASLQRIHPMDVTWRGFLQPPGR